MGTALCFCCSGIHVISPLFIHCSPLFIHCLLFKECFRLRICCHWLIPGGRFKLLVMFQPYILIICYSRNKIPLSKNRVALKPRILIHVKHWYVHVLIYFHKMHEIKSCLSIPYSVDLNSNLINGSELTEERNTKRSANSFSKRLI